MLVFIVAVVFFAVVGVDIEAVVLFGVHRNRVIIKYIYALGSYLFTITLIQLKQSGGYRYEDFVVIFGWGLRCNC